MKVLFNYIKKVFNKLFKRRIKPYGTVFIEELPDYLKERVIYILGEGQYLWSAAMVCPCGCGEILHMSLHKDEHPKWELYRHNDGTVSLWPSVQRKYGCKSHFFFDKGCIKWCKDI